MNQKEFMLRAFKPGDTVSVPVDSLKELISDKNTAVIERDEANNKLESCYDTNEDLIAELAALKDVVIGYKKAIVETNRKISKTLKLTRENDKLRSQVSLGTALRSSLRNQLDIEKFKQPKCPESVTLDTKA